MMAINGQLKPRLFQKFNEDNVFNRGNKPKREITDANSKLVQEYRSINQRLRRENARLRRELSKYVSVEVYGEPDVLEDGGPEENPPVGGGAKCPDCGSVDLHSLKLFNGMWTICKACKWRTK